ATASGKPTAEAHREIKSLVAKHEGDAGLISTAGAYLASTGDPDAGRALLERSIQLQPKLLDARMILARLEAAARNLGAAERHLLDIIKIDSRYPSARVGLAELALAAGDRARSRTLLEEAISADPSAVEPRLRLAKLAFTEGDAARARSLLDQAVSVSKDRKIVFSAAGKVLAQAGLTDEAFAKLREAAAAGHADAALETAQLHLDLDQRKQAREVIEAVLLEKPDWREAQSMLVMLDAQDGQVARAISRAKSLASAASPAEIRVMEGDLYALAGQSDAAIEAYEDAHRQRPSAAIAIKIFDIRRVSGAAPAERSLTQWLQRFPADAEVRRVLAAYYESTGQGERALSEYERLLAADHIDPAMLNN
ncbi:MAG: tetratricopeptide repeat protein, partial [Burkholderiaceae bacterium]